MGRYMQVLRPILLRHRTLLPHNQWRAVCIKAMRAFQATVDELSPQVPPPQCTAGCTAPTSEPCMRFQDLPQGLLVLHEKILCIMHDVLMEPLTPTKVLPSTAPPCEYMHV